MIIVMPCMYHYTHLRSSACMYMYFYYSSIRDICTSYLIIILFIVPIIIYLEKGRIVKIDRFVVWNLSIIEIKIPK